VMLGTVPFVGPEPSTISIHNRFKSLPLSRSSPKSTPEDIWRRSCNRVFAVFAAAETGDIGFDCILDGFDRAFGDSDPDQQPHDRLDHGLQNQPIAVGSRILIVLVENSVVFGDQ
jgi:hypothetical protein